MASYLIVTDEDLAIRAPSDYTILCPRDQRMVSSSDGFFTPSDPWTLNSPSVNFEAAGLSPGQIVLLTKPILLFQSPGETFAVEVVSGHSVTLRRKGQTTGIGQPPGPGIFCSNVEFNVSTLGPQISRVKSEMLKRFGIEDDYLLVPDVNDRDLSSLREAIVLEVLRNAYRNQSRETGSGVSLFSQKANQLTDELEEYLARIVLHWKSLGISTTRFSTRISR